ncbi:hypothetical protein [Streptomyces sp. NRRL S-1824]|uniref:hypothetical protein n=1 Tax=Streptomyces sp. NRRL S-1824 TaxID=1463889 RepID=UPI000A500178|nr:hypothetical protein [Streptomyces sp. NRRL S-1824]
MELAQPAVPLGPRADVDDVLDDPGLDQAAALLHASEVERDLLHQRPRRLFLGGGPVVVAILDEGGYEVVRREHDVVTETSIDRIARGLTNWKAPPATSRTAHPAHQHF